MPSHVIRRFSYDPDSRSLEIAFLNGRHYLYSNVPPDVGTAMQRSFSKGEFFNHRIRDRFPVTRLDKRAPDLLTRIGE
jgi:hypothetical protein